MSDVVVYLVGVLHGVLLLQGARLVNDWRHQRTLRRWMDEQ